MDSSTPRVSSAFAINSNSNKKPSSTYESTPSLPRSKDGNCATVKIGFFELPLFWANVVFALITVLSMVGQNISLPLWIDSTKGNSPGHTVDSYFVLLFTNVVFLVIFGLAVLYIRICSPNALRKINVPHMLLFLVGLFDSLSDAMISFASKGSRTPPYQQNILGNFIIPLTIFFRILIVRKKPSRQKLLSGLVVMIGLFISLIPSVLSDFSNRDQDEVDGISRVMWPIMFMFGFIPAALMLILEEKGLQKENETSEERIGVIYFLFWTTSFQVFCISVFIIWLNILPWYGNVTYLAECTGNLWFGLRCFFGAAGCDYSSGIRGTMYIVMHLLNHIAAACLLRYAEGATWLAIVSSLVTPLGFLFWTLFKEVPFKWQPRFNNSTWCSIVALAIIVPAIFVYHNGAPEISTDGEERRDFEVSHRCRFYRTEPLPDAARPLLSETNNLGNYSV